MEKLARANRNLKQQTSVMKSKRGMTRKCAVKRDVPWPLIYISNHHDDKSKYPLATVMLQELREFEALIRTLKRSTSSHDPSRSCAAFRCEVYAVETVVCYGEAFCWTSGMSFACLPLYHRCEQILVNFSQTLPRLPGYMWCEGMGNSISDA